MKLYLLQLGLLQPLRVPVPGYLIQSYDGTNILVDTGYPYSFIDDPPGPQGPLNLQLEMRPEDYVVNQLASIGPQPDDIHYLVCTHFDPDHAGNHELFSRAELVVQRSHYEVACAGHARSQVVPTSLQLNPDTRVVFPINDEDEARTRASTRKLVKIARREGVTLIVYGHDHKQWPTLKHAPQYYA